MGKALVARLIIRNLACISLVSLTVTASLNRIRSPLLSNSNRKTPPLILTRDSYTKPSFYGVRGSTAAEFVVSAGLDSKKSAVRINRKARQTRNVEKEGFHGFLFPQNEQRQISEHGSGVSRKKKRLYGDNHYLGTVGKIMILDDKFRRHRYKRDLQSSASNKTIRSVLTYIHPDDETFSINSTNEDRSQKKLSLNLMSIIAQADNSSRKAEVQYTSSDDDITKSKLTNITAPILRHLVLSHLVETLMKMKNVSSSHNDFNDTSMRTFNEDFQDGDDILTAAEQKQYGIIVNPYGAVSSVIMNSGSAPAVRVLRGKLVPLPELPPELVPIILGTYNPTYINSDDPKLTAGMIDSALSTLLQHEDLLNIEHLTSQIQSLPIGGKVATRKSPSTNHIGSMKSTEPNLVLNAYRPTVDYMPDWRPGPRCDRLTEEICLDDSDYPSSAIMSSIYKDKARFDLMYAEVKERESQVDGLSRKQEQQYTFDHYFGATSPGAVAVHPVDYGPRGGFVCPSEVHYARPHRAKNRKGVWKVVVNVAEYTQTLRMEKCLSAGNPCKYVVNHMQSSCSQVYNYHRLLVFNKDQGLHIDAFRVPSACACHIRGHNHRYSQPHPYRGNYEDYTGHVESSPSIVSESVSSNKKKKNNFSNTLWAILGGGQQAGSLAQSPQFLDEVRKQISWTQQMKHFPQLMKHVSPYQVLRQLLDEDDEDDERMVTRRQPNRQIHRYKIEQLPHRAFATSHVPVSVAVRDSPIPVMPSEQINRLPAADGKQLFTVGSNPKTAFNPPGNQKTIFALPDNPSIITQAQDKVSLLVEPSSIAFKIQPGMHLPGNGKIQISEDQLVPVAPQFSDTNIKDSPFRPLLKPMPAPNSSKTKIVEDEDLIAVEKSSGETSLHAFLAEAASKVNEKHDRDHNSKINFSYHPILEYLSL